METTPFFVLLFVHLASLILGFGAVMLTDLYGVLWIRDRLRFKQMVRVSGVNEMFVWIGWAGMVVSGVPLLVLKGEVDNLMVIKLFFVVLIGINGIVLHRIQSRLEGFGDGEIVPHGFMFRLGLALFVSQFGWWGALVIGFLHRHVWPVIDWPENPWLAVAGIVAVLLALWGAGEAYLRKKGRFPLPQVRTEDE